MIPFPMSFRRERKSKLQALFDIIRIPFGFIIKWLYGVTDSYLVAILLFALILKIVMFPLGIKQQKNSQKQAQLRPKENVIRKKYAGRNDRATQMKMNTEIQELYQKENFSPFGGCLPMLVQMLVLLAVYAVVRAPLTYTASLPTAENFDTVESIKQTVSYMVYEEDATRLEEERQIAKFLNVKTKQDDTAFWDTLAKGGYNYYSEINIINFLDDEENRAAFVAFYDSQTHHLKGGAEVKVGNGLDFGGEQIVEVLPDLEVFNGFNLGTIPSFSLFKAEQIGAKLLLIIPVLTLITAYFGQALTRKFTYQPEMAPEMQSQNRMMSIFMPLFSLYISFQVPAAVGIYWMVSNVLSPVQQIALAKMFPIAEITPEQMREAERLYGAKQKKKKVSAGNGAKKKSLVYDDDDEYESVSTAPEKKVLKEKKNSDGESVVKKAPLKEEENQ